ncbi:TPA: hypothetical protein ACJIWN_002127 [Enterobacter cloacae]|uniref:hypothetical protein n=1 Tax=Enterobacter cloacae TaxID=550 RepID=UPI0032AF9B03
MSTITKERLEPVIERLEHYATNVKWTNVQAAKDMLIAVDAMRRLLASLEAEPVSVIKIDHESSLIKHVKKVVSETNAPPAQVSVLDLTALNNLAGEMLNHAMNCERRVAVAYTHCAHRLAEEVRDLRDAMLQGADGNSQVIPDGLRLALSNAGIAAPESDEMLYATHEKYVQMLVDWAKDRKPFKSVVIPDAYDIESFGIFSATEGENGLILQIELFRFGSEKCPKIGKENMVPKFALQGVINRLQNHCDSMGNETLVNILSTPAAPQQEAE